MPSFCTLLPWNCSAVLVQDAFVLTHDHERWRGMLSMGVLRNAFSHGASRLITPNAAVSHFFLLLRLLAHWPRFR